jgi:hypothetical protein
VISSDSENAVMNANLYLTLRQGFPANLDAIAIETDQGLCYS